MRLVAALTVLALTAPALAHSGGTDANGGHYNRKTGTYHYHGGGSGSSGGSGASSSGTRRETKNPNTYDGVGAGMAAVIARSATPKARTEAPEARVAYRVATPPVTVVLPPLESTDEEVARKLWLEAQAKRDTGQLLEAISIALPIPRRYEGTAAAKEASAFLALHPEEIAARELLMLAKNYAKAGMNEKALELCKEVLAKYPETKSAEAAKRLLQEL